jgi:hypothetical protein
MLTVFYFLFKFEIASTCSYSKSVGLYSCPIRLLKSEMYKATSILAISRNHESFNVKESFRQN